MDKKSIEQSTIMNPFIYTLLMVILLISCTETQETAQIGEPARIDSTDNNMTKTETIDYQKAENIAFDFTVKKVNPYKDILEIEAVIINHNSYPVYFKTRTCYELQSDLIFDKSVFSLGYVSTCRAYFSVINELAAHSKFVYKTSLNNYTHASTIKLGLAFYAVNKPKKELGDIFEGYNFDLATNEKIKTKNYRDYEQKWEFKNETQTVIWAEEKPIN